MITAVVLSLALSPVGQAAPSVSPLAKVAPSVLADLTSGGQSSFLVILKDQADIGPARLLSARMGKARYVFNAKQAAARRSQPAVKAALDALGVEYRAYSIVNMFWVQGDLNAVRILAARDDVAAVDANPAFRMDLPRPAVTDRAQPATIEWNVSQVGAPSVWSAGFTGQGYTVASNDTGVLWTHPALQPHYRGWNGTTANHDYNWHDAVHGSGGDCPAPCDPFGHGTHTTGTMVGDDGMGNQIGVASGAQWIACRNMDATGTGSVARYVECFEWDMAPYPVNGTPAQGDPSKAPVAVNNSWDCPASEGCVTGSEILTATNALEAAGIVVAASAGNSGPGCSTVSPAIASYAASYTVGATDSTDTIASFSSRGPVTWDLSNRVKPNISAPGVNVRSAWLNNSYAVLSGTSMAAPHVTGSIALLLSARPVLSGNVEAIESAFDISAVPRTPPSPLCGSDMATSVPNNAYGWGRLNVAGAIFPLRISLPFVQYQSR